MEQTSISTKKLCEKYLRGSHILNLATSSQNRPSNRDMFYIVPTDFTQTIYVMTPTNAQKLIEIEDNPYVAFSTEPTKEDQGVVTSNTAMIARSNLSFNDVAHLVAKQVPEWENQVGKGRDNFVVLAITFPTAKIFGKQGIESIVL
ncbi:pyridoxamine 5'-phosphate oxidase family protein [Weissella diestrammenae]|uniref:Pyridoxamine 5'-phosphate oxidase family protein n=1 Tax=Weissella diestrammenae TaxID=1162633 RepID=A0A7G9T5Z0_9LACO|nr:pyridoxamine 5'-phosphate oxidase family protein [Weissella diestrammenae]MCM0582348.1 pyridoxamine 5'-phosphate oxidase family protein [Weissella diestrammenae]QNN75515.1 pyridoxamine 5'-phosphate oxidase family protein [Weissella diestrammenae]